MYTNVHLFFTAWVLGLVVFHHWTHKYIDLLYLTFIVTITGFYLSIIHPRQYSFRLFDEQYKLTSWDRFLIVDIIHIFAFIFIASRYKSKLDMKLLLAIALICLYSLVINCKDIYMINTFELVSVITCATLLYVILYSQK